MRTKKAIVKSFSKYCSKCNGQCCKQGVFTVFESEMKTLQKHYGDFHVGKVVEERGKAKDISICGKCVFAVEQGCKLALKERAADCLTYPFYPKLKDNQGKLHIDSFVVQRECPYSAEIALDTKLLKSVHKYWETIVKKLTADDIIDWLGNNGSWHEWYKNTIPVKSNLDFSFNLRDLRKRHLPFPQMLKHVLNIRLTILKFIIVLMLFLLSQTAIAQ